MKLTLFLIGFMLCFSWTANGVDLKNGEKLFMKKCKGCHRLTEGVKVGPGLAGVTKRRTEEWLDEWIRNPKAMIAKGDPIAVALKKKFKKTMRKIGSMQIEKNRKDVINFLKLNDSKLEKSEP